MKGKIIIINLWKFYILFLVLLVPSFISEAQTPEEKIIAKEKALLDRWKQGDTFGFIETADSNITYFDPTLAKRIDGIEKFRDYLSSFNGTFSFPSYELLSPIVQVYGDIGILTFNFVGHLSNDWKIVSSHWSHTKP
jgi:hypothetical protein